MNNTYELQVVDRLTGRVHSLLTKMFNDSLLENVEGIVIPPQYRIQIRE